MARWIGGVILAAIGGYITLVLLQLLPPPAVVAGWLRSVVAPAMVEVWDPAPGAQPTQEEGMHACPQGMALAGIRLENDFLCRQVARRPTDQKTKTSRAERQEYESHTCPKGTYIRGMNVAENRFLCSEHDGGQVGDMIQVRTGDLICAASEVAVGFNRRLTRLLCSSLTGS